MTDLDREIHALSERANKLAALVPGTMVRHEVRQLVAQLITALQLVAAELASKK